jgi:hypothetical protein
VSPRSRRSPGELRRGYRHPIRRDRALWVALGLSAGAIVIEFALARPDTLLGWVAFAILAAALAAMIITLTGVAVGTLRGFSDGWRSARPSQAPARPDSQEATMADDRPDPTAPEPTTADAEPSSPTGSLPRPAVPESVKNLAASAQAKAPKKADVDRTARALGRAAGAARRAYRKDD